MLSIDIGGLGDGLHALSFAVSADDLDLDPAVFKDIRIDVRIDRIGNRLRTSFAAAAVAQLVCDRTLVEYEEPLSGSYEVVFGPAELVREGSADDEEDLQVLLPHQRAIDLTHVVRDTLLLAVPQRKIAPDADDADLQLQFGVEASGERIDPRWEALNKLKKERHEE